MQRGPVHLVPGNATLSFAPSSLGPTQPKASAQDGAPMSALPAVHSNAPPGAHEAAAASTSSATAAQYQHVQRQCPIPPSVQQQAFEPGTSRTFGVFGLGTGSPGPLGGTLNPPPMHAFNALFHDSPPGIPAVSTAGMSPAGPIIGHAENAAVPHAKLP